MSGSTQSAPIPILLAMTVATGIVDAVSFLSLGRIFTANMTGNVVLLGFALAGTSGLSVLRSCVALAGFLVGAEIGGRMSWNAATTGRCVARAFLAESLLLGTAAAFGGAHKAWAVIVITAVAMGLRNATVRKLGVPDLTTTVLTLTITGLAADSTFARGGNPRWRRRAGSILAMVLGAFAGARMITHSSWLPLAICCFLAAACAVAQSLMDIEWRT